MHHSVVSRPAGLTLAHGFAAILPRRLARMLHGGTWRMLGDAPQPDADLRIIEECGGKSHLEGKYVAGVPS